MSATWSSAVVHEQGDVAREVDRRRLLYRIVTGLFVVGVVLTALDAVDALDVWGVDDATYSADSGAYELEVRVGTVSRPGLATPFVVSVRHRGGFDRPIRLAVDQRYMALWDANGFVPTPAEETADGTRVIYQFAAPPAGDRFVMQYDGRIEPAAQTGRDGFVALLDASGAEIVRVDFETRLMP